MGKVHGTDGHHGGDPALACDGVEADDGTGGVAQDRPEEPQVVAGHRHQGQRHQHQVQLLLPEHNSTSDAASSLCAASPIDDRRGWRWMVWGQNGTGSSLLSCEIRCHDGTILFSGPLKRAKQLRRQRGQATRDS
jgi:hypothetical protein